MIKWLKGYRILADGAVFQHLQVVPESLVRTGQGYIQLHNWKGLLQLWWRFRKQRLPGTTPYVSVHNSYRGYYHWLLESVPKLLEAQRAIPDFTLLLPADYTEAFYADTLRLLGVTKIEWLQPRTLYQVPTLALPYGAEAMGDYAPQALAEVKAAFLQAVPATAVPGPERLYISRRKATRRKVLNEDAVEQLLAAYGFTALCFEDYTFEEQVRLCANAKILVGIHGAGLANMVFLPGQATVVEFRKFDNGHNYFFTQLATTLLLDYHLLYCAAQDEQQSVQDADLWVDLAALQAVLPPAAG